VVYLAFDRELGKRVALKILRPERASDAGVARFRREVAVARDISSPRLVRVFDIGTSENAIYLTMEIVEGESLKERLRAGALPIERAIAITIAMLEGLDALHSAGVIHRDIKPGNVLLGRSGEIKLGDFGLARAEVDLEGVTHSGTLLGTSEYISPEQALDKEVDARSDLYSLGIVMFEMLTGQIPFPSASALGGLLARIKGPPPDPRTLNPAVPRWLARIVVRLLDRRPSERYARAQRVLDDLHRRRARIRLKPRTGAVAIAAIVFLILIGFAVRQRIDAAKFSHLTVLATGGVAAIDRGGSTLWSAIDVDARESRYAFARIERGGEPLLAAVRRNPTDWDPERGHTLSLLDLRSGTTVKQVALPRGDLGFPEASLHFALETIEAVDLDRDGVDEIIGTYVNRAADVSYAFLYEPRIERARLIFRGTGRHRFATAADLDGDGASEVILSGTSDRFGMYGSATALRLVPPVNRPGRVTEGLSVDLLAAAEHEEAVVWQALLPRQPLGAAGRPAFDAATRTLAFPLANGAKYVLSADGFPEDGTASVGGVESRRDARSQSYAFLREAAQHEGSGEIRAATAAIERAVERAEPSGDPLLIEAVRREHARLLVVSGAVEEGEGLFEELLASSPHQSEIALQAARAHHVVGRLDDAEAWYRRALAAGGASPDPEIRLAYLEGMTLALAEQKRWEEALEVAGSWYARFGGAHDWPGVYREFIYWRMGQPPAWEEIRISDPRIEPARYWLLEFRNFDGAEPAALLPGLDRALWSESMRPLVYSLRAELLSREGRREEALTEARRARRLALERSRKDLFLRAHLDLLAARFRRIEGEARTGEAVEPAPEPFVLTSDPPVCDKRPPVGPAVQLRWSASQGAASYDVYRNGALSGDRAELAGTAYYNSVGLVPGATYRFHVRAHSADAHTDSNVITVTIPPNICE
jgi:tetratricopeptide (TPR) repeat protein